MEQHIVWKQGPIGSWAQFHRSVRRPGKELLERLDEYGSSILVSGCQRSGTTALTHLLNRTACLADYTFGRDSELDGALLLAGCVARFTTGRHCFQTTYLNDRFPEYFLHDSFRLIWVLREPRSVVYSMLHNWKRGALNRLYDACGRDRYSPAPLGPSLLRRWTGPSRFDKACASYIAKTEQVHVLTRELGDRMLLVDYDELVSNPATIVHRICTFADVPFDARLAGALHERSSRRGDRLAPWQASRVDDACLDAYRSAMTLRPVWRLRHV